MMLKLRMSNSAAACRNDRPFIADSLQNSQFKLYAVQLSALDTDPGYSVDLIGRDPLAK